MDASLDPGSGYVSMVGLGSPGSPESAYHSPADDPPVGQLNWQEVTLSDLMWSGQHSTVHRGRWSGADVAIKTLVYVEGREGVEPG